MRRAAASTPKSRLSLWPYPTPSTDGPSGAGALLAVPQAMTKAKAETRSHPRRAEQATAGSGFPALDAPIQPPFPAMEARVAARLPRAGEWLYEPKWDGFRCLAFRSGETVALQSKSGQPLTRYFPELVAALAALRPQSWVLDGEIVIGRDGASDFDALLQRIH